MLIAIITVKKTPVKKDVENFLIHQTGMKQIILKAKMYKYFFIGEYLQMKYLHNKYSACYESIISNARNRILKSKQYYENHHIIPECLGGLDTKENLVYLTYREHYICHLLLTKIYDGEAKSKMCWALHCLSYSKKVETKLYSRSYELVRKIHIKNLRKNHPARKNPEKFSAVCSANAQEQWNGEGSEERRKKHSEIRKECLKNDKNLKKNLDKHCRIISSLGGQASKRKWEENPEWATKQKQLMSERTSGEKNPSYGVPRTEEQKRKQSIAISEKRWVMKDGKNYYIHYSMLEQYLANGFIRGKTKKRKENR